jgi:hypothetical protein
MPCAHTKLVGMFSQRSLNLEISNSGALATVTQEGKHRRIAGVEDKGWVRRSKMTDRPAARDEVLVLLQYS